MQIKKTYTEVSPELLYAEIRDFTLKQGVTLGENKLETFTLPDESSSFVTRATLTFNTGEKTGKECLRAHIVGMARGETKLMIDVDESLFPPEKLTALQSDLDFIFGAYEVK
jgi:7-cyano-7-deazaguanine synthase in queuosine biosynthesis